MCGFHSSYQYSLFGQIGFVHIFVEYKSLQKVIMMTTTLQVYVCRIRESQSCGFGSEETCSRQRFSLWARDRPGLNKSFKTVERLKTKYVLLHLSNQNMIYQDINLVWSKDEIILKRQFWLCSGWLGWTWALLLFILFWAGNYYYFQVDWAEPEHEVDEETMSTVKVKNSRIFFLYLYSNTVYYF